MESARLRSLGLATLLVLSSHARGGNLENVVASLPAPVRSGYASSTAGATILYHSVNPHARTALLARTTDGTQFVEWTTDAAPAPAAPRGRVYAWLAALSGSKGEHAFDLAVNGKTTFRFRTAPDSTHTTWTEAGPGGSKLVFCATEADRFGDLFGYMFLVLPPRFPAPGSPLTLRVTGEAAGSQAWFMVFEHRVADAAWIRPIPALVGGTGGAVQPVSIDIEHYGKGGNAAITMEEGERLNGRLTWGLSSFMVRSSPVTSPAGRRVRVVSGKDVLADTVIVMHPVQKRTLYLLPHSHTDIGYSAYQAVVEKNHMRYIDDAIAIANRTSAYPEGARFKWNIEVMWPLESYIASASPEGNDRLARGVEAGEIGLNGLYSNVLTGLCSQEELFHLTDFARKVSGRYAHPVKAAMISDIPAYSSSIVPALHRAGIRYFSSGPNYVPSLPDGGDRIGCALKTWGDRPFYWVSASGEDTVLFWMAGRGYSWFHGLNMGELGAAHTGEIFDYIGELDARQYPYDMVQVRYTVGGDNGPPDPDLPDVVRKWNEEYISPRFAIATTEELFEKFEKKFGSALPVRQGDLTPYWEDGAASTARELAENRETADALVQTEALYGLFAPPAYRPQDDERAWRGVHLFDEHTWGASNSITDPDSPDVEAQWEYKLAFLRSAEDGERALRSAVARPFPTGVTGSIDIVNTGSWNRTGIVLLPGDLRISGLRVRDGLGRPVPAQRISTGETALLLTGVPAFGCSRLTFEPGDAFTPPFPASASGTTLRSGNLEAVVDPATGVIRSLSAGGTEMAVRSGEGLNRYLYVPGRDPARAVTGSNVSLRVTDSGPLVAAIAVQSVPPGGKKLTQIVRVCAGTGRVDIIDSLWKSGVREKESVHFGFPFGVPGGTTRIGNAFSVIRPDSDQLPGSCRDFFCAAHWADVSNDSNGVLLAVPDAPLIETGSMTDETQNGGGARSWKVLAGAGTRLYSYVMNNYWHTNYRADQEGEATFRYALVPHGKFDPAAAERWGIEVSRPLIPLPPDERRVPGESLLRVEPPAVIATSFKPASDGRGWILHLYNAGSAVERATLHWQGKAPARFYLSDLAERRGEPTGAGVVLPPSGIRILRIE